MRSTSRGDDDDGRANIRLARELGRKALHLTSTTVPVLLSLGIGRRVLVPALAVLAGCAIAVEVMRRRSRVVRVRFEALFAPLLRAHEHHRLTGATWLLLAFLGAVLVFPRAVAIAALWAAAAGDAAAALVGMPFGRHRAERSGKSLEGSAACAVVSALGAWSLAALPPWIAVVAGVAAALAERASWPDDDNVRIVAVTGAVVWLCVLVAS